MPAFILYGSRGSTNTDRVRLTLAEGNFTDYEIVLLNLQKAEQKVRNLCLLLKDEVASLCSRDSSGIVPEIFSLVKLTPSPV